VPALCAICLGTYETGDCVTWSPSESCQHAFHTECILEWLAKKAPSIVASTNTNMDNDSTKCPLCRTEFCPVATAKVIESIRVRQQQQNNSLRERFLASHNDVTSANIIESFTQALALSHLYRPGTFNGNNGQNNRNDSNNLTFYSVDGTVTANNNTAENPTTVTGPAGFFQLGARRTGTRRYPVASIMQTAEQQQAAAHASILQQLQQQVQQQLDDTTVQQPHNETTVDQPAVTNHSRRRFFRSPFSNRTTDRSGSNINTNNVSIDSTNVTENAMVLPLAHSSNTTETPMALVVPPTDSASDDDAPSRHTTTVNNQ
jgi:Ring finger domain